MSDKTFEKPNCNKCTYQYNCPCGNSCCNSACLTIYKPKVFEEISKERIKCFGENIGKLIEATPFETVINADNEEDKKILESVFNI